MANKNIYESFHQGTRSQSKIVYGNNFTYRHIIYFIDKYLTKNTKVLDIGCGAGTLCFISLTKVNRVLGFDISIKAIKSLQRKCENTRFRQIS